MAIKKGLAKLYQNSITERGEKEQVSELFTKIKEKLNTESEAKKAALLIELMLAEDDSEYLR